MKKARHLLFCILPLLLAILIHVCITILFKAGMYLYTACISDVTDRDIFTFIKSTELSSKQYPFVMMIGASFCIILFYRFYKRKEFEEPGSFSTRLFPALLILGVSLQMLFFSVIYYPVQSEIAQAIISKGTYETSPVEFFLPALIFEVLFAPISDGLIFRGITLKLCQRNMPFIMANIVQALLFGIYHMNLFQGVYAFFFGLFLGYVMHRTKAIIAPIFLHMIINLSGNLVSYIHQSIFLIRMEIIFAITLILIVLSLRYIKINTKINVNLI